MTVRLLLLCGLLLGLNVLDATLTHAAGVSGTLVEANPLMAGLIDYSWTAFWVVKMSLMVVAVSVLVCLSRLYPKSAFSVVMAAVVGFAAICAVNALATV